MNITVIGTGYVGLVSGVCLAHIGHNVIMYDIDFSKIEKLQQGIVPIYEPGLEDLIKENESRITFTTDEEMSFTQSSVIISAVGTPMGKSYQADLQFVEKVAYTFSKYCSNGGFKLLVNKSTVPVGTAEHITTLIENDGVDLSTFEVISNPEFLREGNAIHDCMHPARIVVGCSTQRSREIMQEVYNYFHSQQKVLFTDVKSAELIKYSSNAMLATRISFINEIAQFCNEVGADIDSVAKGMGLDPRIGPHFLEAGCGYGGSCFPKDVQALMFSGQEVGVDFSILRAVEEVNAKSRVLPVKMLQKQISNLEGIRVMILGIAFKEDTDDIRESPSLYVIEELVKLGCIVGVYDKVAMKSLREFRDDLQVVEITNIEKSSEEYDCAIIMTKWEEFYSLGVDDFKGLNHKLLIDPRRVLKSREKEFKDSGMMYLSVDN